jgi:hypothetical protein
MLLPENFAAPVELTVRARNGKTIKIVRASYSIGRLVFHVDLHKGQLYFKINNRFSDCRGVHAAIIEKYGIK